MGGRGMKKNIINTVIAVIAVAAIAVTIAIPLRYVINRKTEYVGQNWLAGFARESIVPLDYAVTDYYAGGFMDTTPTVFEEVADTISVRSVCINDGSGNGTLALVSVDAIGLSYQDIKDIRSYIYEYTLIHNIYGVEIFATGTHYAPDTVGMSGDILSGISGRRSEHIKVIKEKVSSCVRIAFNNMKEGSLYYGSADISKYVTDLRNQGGFDKNLNRLRFVPKDGGRVIYMVNASVPLTTLGHGSPIMSADFPAYISEVIDGEDADFMFIQGATGGLIQNEASFPTPTGDELLCEALGRELAETILGIASENETLIEGEIVYKKTQLDLPVETGFYTVLINNSLVNMGEKTVNEAIYVPVEVGYIGFSDVLSAVCMPGIAFPTVIFGGGEESLQAAFGEGRVICFGLSGGYVGNIIPEDDYVEATLPPVDGHHEELNSLGKATAEIILEKLAALLPTSEK